MRRSSHSLRLPYTGFHNKSSNIFAVKNTCVSLRNHPPLTHICDIKRKPNTTFINIIHIFLNSVKVRKCYFLENYNKIYSKIINIFLINKDFWPFPSLISPYSRLICLNFTNEIRLKAARGIVPLESFAIPIPQL